MQSAANKKFTVYTVSPNRLYSIVAPTGMEIASVRGKIRLKKVVAALRAAETTKFSELRKIAFDVKMNG